MDCSETNPRVLIRAKRAFVGDVNLMSTTSSDFTNFAEEVIARCRKLASFSEDAGGTRRTFLSAPMRDCHREVSSWMKARGMNVSVDAVGNLRGLYVGTAQAAPRILMGSHLDTVQNAGAFDGI